MLPVSPEIVSVVAVGVCVGVCVGDVDVAVGVFSCVVVASWQAKIGFDKPLHFETKKLFWGCVVNIC